MRRQVCCCGSAAVFLAGWIAAIVVQGQEQTKNGRGLVHGRSPPGRPTVAASGRSLSVLMSTSIRTSLT